MSDSQPPTAVILAGGLGTRLRSVVSDQPKVLAPIAGRPFVCYLLDQVLSWGLTKVVLCTGYLGEQVEQQLGGEYFGLNIEYSREATPLGTGGALRLAADRVASETAVVLNGDSYCDADFGIFYQTHRLREAQASLVLANVSDTHRFGAVRIDADGHISCFQEKGGEGGPGLVNAGVYLIETGLLRRIPRGDPVSLERDVFPAWIGGRFFGYETTADFLDVGTPESYASAEAFFAGLKQRGRVAFGREGQGC